MGGHNHTHDNARAPLHLATCDVRMALMNLCAWGCEPRETQWMGGGGWQAVTAEGCWLCPERRQMAVGWPALWQYCAQKARTICTLGIEQLWVP